MKKILYLEVEASPFETEETLAKKLKGIKGFEFFQYFPEDRKLDLKREQEWLTTVGFTESFNLDENSGIVTTTEHTPDDIVGILQKYLDIIITTDTLIIIDRFFFPDSADDDYPNFVFSILEKYLPNLKEIKFIVSPNHNVNTKNNIESLLLSKNPSLRISLSTSEKFHDRFWISDENCRGAFLGTSLNGFGRRIALIDYINLTDVKLIIKELQNLGL